MQLSEIEPNFWRWTVAHFRKGVDIEAVKYKNAPTKEVAIDGLIVPIPMTFEEYREFNDDVTKANKAMGNTENWTAYFYYWNRNERIQVKYGAQKGSSRSENPIFWSKDALIIPQEYLAGITLPPKESFTTSPTLGRRYAREYLSDKFSDMLNGMDATPLLQ